MKIFLTLLLSCVFGAGLFAQTDAEESAFCRQLIAVSRMAVTDYREHRGRLEGENKRIALYAFAPSATELKATKQHLEAPKDGTRAYFYADYTGEASIAFVEGAFLRLAGEFSRDGTGQLAGFTADAKLRKQDDGELQGFVFYKGIIVAKLSIPAKRDEATLFVGLLFSENIAADVAVLAPPPPASPEPAPATWGSPLADDLMRLHRIANANYNGLIGAEIDRNDEGVAHFAAPLMLGADKAVFLQMDRFGCCLRLTFNRTNPIRRQVEKETKALMVRLAGTGRYQWGDGGEQSAAIQDGGRDILEYSISSLESDPDNFTVTVDQTLPLVADEAAYAGKFPAVLKSGNTPQIREIRGQGVTADSYERDNGIIRHGKLVIGTKTFHGYGDYLDGVWYSDEWVPSYGTRYTVIFRPASSFDVIYGAFHKADMSDFGLSDMRHGNSIYSLKPDAPKWLSTAWPAQQERLAADKRAHEAVVAAQAGRYNRDSDDESDEPRSTSPSSSNTQSRTTTHIYRGSHQCLTCGGTGRVRVTDSFGHSTTEFCRECSGQGMISN